MDLFDEEELLAQMQSGNFMAGDEEDDDDDEEGLDFLREMEQKEAKVRKTLFKPSATSQQDQGAARDSMVSWISQSKYRRKCVIIIRALCFLLDFPWPYTVFTSFPGKFPSQSSEVALRQMTFLSI